MKIVVAGGTGFLGSHLCKKLVAQNHFVICIDNNITGSYKNIESLINAKNFLFLERDIREDIIIESDIDQIYNLACPASPPKYQKYPIFTLNTCFNGTQKLLKLAKSKNARFLLASTSEIYGEPQITPQHEKYRGNVNTIGIRSCYYEGKRIAETLTMEYNRQYNNDTRIIRIFNTYGPNMDPEDGRVITNFINQAINNEDITIYGDGEQTRSFCYVDDLIDGMIKCMNSEYKLPINLGNPIEMKIKEIAELILLLTNSKSKIIRIPLPEDDPTNRKPDINIARTILSWEPKVDLIEGLKKTIDYFEFLN